MFSFVPCGNPTAIHLELFTTSAPVLRKNLLDSFAFKNMVGTLQHTTRLLEKQTIELKQVVNNLFVEENKVWTQDYNSCQIKDNFSFVSSYFLLILILLYQHCSHIIRIA